MLPAEAKTRRGRLWTKVLELQRKGYDLSKQHDCQHTASGGANHGLKTTLSKEPREVSHKWGGSTKRKATGLHRDNLGNREKRRGGPLQKQGNKWGESFEGGKVKEANSRSQSEKKSSRRNDKKG